MSGLYLEPFLGYRIGKIQRQENTQTYKFNTHGQIIGGRVGYNYLYFSSGFEVNYGEMNASVKSAPIGTTSESYTTSGLGVFVNVELPLLFRFWGTYYLSQKYENSISEDFNGDGYSLGVGLTTLPFVTINLEAKYLKFSEID